jgi:hypothetical protein
MEKDMIELHDISQGHPNHHNNNPIYMGLIIISSICLKVIHLLTITEMNEIASFLVTLGQGALITTGLIVFRWSWIDRKKKKRNGTI